LYVCGIIGSIAAAIAVVSALVQVVSVYGKGPTTAPVAVYLPYDDS
jgi:hypothetical protein